MLVARAIHYGREIQHVVEVAFTPVNKKFGRELLGNEIAGIAKRVVSEWHWCCSARPWLDDGVGMAGWCRHGFFHPAQGLGVITICLGCVLPT